MKKIRLKKIFLLIPISVPAVFLSLVPIITMMNISNNKNTGGSLGDLIDFKEPGFTIDQSPYWESLSNSSVKSLAYYKNKINEDLTEHMSKVDEQNSKTKFIKENSFLPGNKRNIKKNNLIDGIYLGYQIFGNASPSFSEMGETNRFEISNFHALESNGYNIYVNNSNPDLVSITNLSKTNSYINKDDGLKYYMLKNEQGDDSVFYKLNPKYNITKSSYGESSTIKLVAVLDENSKISTPPHLKNDKPKTLQCIDPLYNSNSRKIITPTLQKKSSNDYIEWNLWEWIIFYYAKNSITPQLYSASILLSLYTTAGLNYMDYINPYSIGYNIKTEILTGINNLYKAGLTSDEIKKWDNVDAKKLIGTLSADQLYYNYKYDSYYDRFIIKKRFSFGQSDIYVTVDQNMPISNSDDNLKRLIKDDSTYMLENNPEKISLNDSLPYNKWFEFNSDVKDFCKKTWNRIFEIKKLEDKNDRD